MVATSRDKPEVCYTPEEVASLYLKCNVNEVYELISAGRLRALNRKLVGRGHGKRWLVPASAIARFQAQMEANDRVTSASPSSNAKTAPAQHGRSRAAPPPDDSTTSTTLVDEPQPAAPRPRRRRSKRMNQWV